MSLANTHGKQFFDGMQFEPPSEFQLVETMLSLRMPPKQELRDPRLVQGILNKQTSVQSNLIVHRRQAKKGATLEELVGEACAEFIRAMVNIQNITKQEFTFTDKTEGMLVSFDFPTSKTKTIRQYHAFRLEEGRLTTLTLTVDSLQLTAEQEEVYLKSLASLSQVETD